MNTIIDCRNKTVEEYLNDILRNYYKLRFYSIRIKQ